MTRGRKRVAVTVPLADDLAVYARLWLRYQDEQTTDVLALCVLAQRVVVEKGRAYYKRRGRTGELKAALDRINNDLDYARSIVGVQSKGCRLGILYPVYHAAGLLP